MARAYVYLSLVGVCLAALGAAYAVGRDHGYDAAEARAEAARLALQGDLFDLADRLSERERELLAARDALAGRQEAFENGARTDPDACIVGPDGLRRLRTLWGPAD